MKQYINITDHKTLFTGADDEAHLIPMKQTKTGLWVCDASLKNDPHLAGNFTWVTDADIIELNDSDF